MSLEFAWPWLFTLLPLPLLVAWLMPRAGELQGPERGEQEHRIGGDQHVPPEDQRFHLERPGGQQVRRPLETEAADAKRRQHAAAARSAHDRQYVSTRNASPAKLTMTGPAQAGSLVDCQAMNFQPCGVLVQTSRKRVSRCFFSPLAVTSMIARPVTSAVSPQTRTFSSER